MRVAPVTESADYISMDWNLAVAEEAEMTYSNRERFDTVAGGGSADKKIIQTAHVYMQTDQFDDTVAALRDIAVNVGGFIENSHLSDYYNHSRYSDRQPERLREFSITLRVPRESFDWAMFQVEGLALVRSSNQSAEDVTAQFFDLAGRLETKYIERERVLDMISRAETIEDLLALENRLGQINTDIERFQSQMTSIDRLSAFSTIHVQLNEVTTETLIISTEGLSARMNQAFTRSINSTLVFFQNVLIFLAGAVIPLTFIGLLTFAGIKAARIGKCKQRDD
jgi:coenzyme F420-reducing hydrogenase alpha subunit